VLAAIGAILLLIWVPWPEVAVIAMTVAMAIMAAREMNGKEKLLWIVAVGLFAVVEALYHLLFSLPRAAPRD
jgi:hypothetical protein